DGGRRADEPGDRRPALPQPAHRRVAPSQSVREARRQLSPRASGITPAGPHDWRPRLTPWSRQSVPTGHPDWRDRTCPRRRLRPSPEHDPQRPIPMLTIEHTPSHMLSRRAVYALSVVLIVVPEVPGQAPTKWVCLVVSLACAAGSLMIALHRRFRPA